jgi:TonB family protein
MAGQDLRGSESVQRWTFEERWCMATLRLQDDDRGSVELEIVRGPEQTVHLVAYGTFPRRSNASQPLEIELGLDTRIVPIPSDPPYGSRLRRWKWALEAPLDDPELGRISSVREATLVIPRTVDREYFHARLDGEGLSYAWRSVTTCQPLPPAPPREPRTLRPEKIHHVDAEYTWAAREARIQGVIILELEIDAEGRVRDPVVVKPLGYGLDEAAIEAVSQWRYKSAMEDGRPVATRYNATINFRLW